MLVFLLFHSFHKWREVSVFFQSVGVVKEKLMGWSLKESLKFMVKASTLLFCLFLPINGIPRILKLISATANGIMEYLDSNSIDEEQVTQLYFLTEISHWFPFFKVFDVWCRSSLRILSFWAIIINIGILDTGIDAPLSNRKKISTFWGNFQTLSLLEWIYRI